MTSRLGRSSAAAFVVIGGALGAVARFSIGGFVATGRIPTPVVMADTLGTFPPTLLVVFGAGEDATLLGAGFCGSLTTFSTFSVRTVSLWQDGDVVGAVGVATGTLLACLAGVGLAVVLGAVL